MKWNKQQIFLTVVSTITIVLLVLGAIFQQEPHEKINGFLGLYAVSSNDTIVYLSYDQGVPEIYTHKDGKETLLYTGDISEQIIDMTFSEQADQLYFITGKKEVEEDIRTAVQAINLQSKQVETIFEKEAFMTELAIGPDDDAYIYYIQAHTVTNYSPIASKRPHEMDAYRYHIEKEEHSKLTHFQAYDMASLQVSHDEDTIYMTMESQDADTPDEIFEDTFQIWKLPFQQQRDLENMTPSMWEYDIQSMTIVPNEDGVVFSGVNNYAQGDIFEYELFYYEWNAEDYKRLTDLGGNAFRAIFSNENTMYFTVDKNFGRKNPSYHLYKMNIQDETYTEVELDHLS